jgi:hypothetical protein
VPAREVSEWALARLFAADASLPRQLAQASAGLSDPSPLPVRFPFEEQPPMRVRRRPSSAPGLSWLAVAVLFAGCTDGGRSPAGPEALAPVQPPSHAIVVECRASIKGLGMSCQAPRGTAGAAAGVILGRQNVDVRLSSNDLTVVADTFAFDLSIQNVLPQPTSGQPQRLGVDSLGVTHPIQIFFSQEPFAPSGGSVEVSNPDGFGAFTTGNQPYYEYPVVLDSGEVSPDRRWKLRFSPEVDSLTFRLLVSVAVPRPAGWVDVSPDTAHPGLDSTVTLTDVVRGFAGDVFSGVPVAWTSSDPAVATVDPSTGMVTAHSAGTAVVTGSTPTPGRYGTAVIIVGSLPEAALAGAPENVRPGDRAGGPPPRDRMTAGAASWRAGDRRR